MWDEWYKTDNSTRLQNTNMSDRAIIEAVNKMSGQHKIDQVTYINAVVLSVNKNERSCHCRAIDGHTEYDLPTVLLMASVDDGILIEPEINSTVKVIFSQNIEPFVVQFSEIKNITIFANTKVQLQDGSFGGIVKVTDLVSKLNKIETDLNNLKSGLIAAISAASATGITPVTGVSLAGFMSTLGTYASQIFVLTQKNELENTKVQHGTN